MSVTRGCGGTCALTCTKKLKVNSESENSSLPMPDVCFADDLMNMNIYSMYVCTNFTQTSMYVYRPAHS